MLLFHGTPTQNLTALSPQYYAGANGSQDGVGVNLTDSLAAAQGYGKEGRLLVLSPQVDHFLRMDEATHLSPAQADKFHAMFLELPIDIRLRLATDLNGKKEIFFQNDIEAKQFYKTEKAEIQALKLPDRCLPQVEFEANGVRIFTARREVDVSTVNTQHLHYVLNLCDNRLATAILKELTPGLILPKFSGATHYLSFRREELVLADFSVETTQFPGFTETLKALQQLSGPQWLELLRENQFPSRVAEVLLQRYPPFPPSPPQGVMHVPVATTTREPALNKPSFR